MNIVVIFLGLTVGATATAEAFLNPRTLFILVLGVIAFAMGTAGGVLLAKVMNFFSKGDNKINPLIGSAGVSAVPMAARVSQTEGQKADPVELPADARHGSQRGRRGRFGGRRGHSAFVPRIGNRVPGRTARYGCKRVSVRRTLFFAPVPLQVSHFSLYL